MVKLYELNLDISLYDLASYSFGNIYYPITPFNSADVIVAAYFISISLNFFESNSSTNP